MDPPSLIAEDKEVIAAPSKASTNGLHSEEGEGKPTTLTSPLPPNFAPSLHHQASPELESPIDSGVVFLSLSFFFSPSLIFHHLSLFSAHFPSPVAAEFLEYDSGNLNPGI